MSTMSRSVSARAHTTTFAEIEIKVQATKIETQSTQWASSESLALTVGLWARTSQSPTNPWSCLLATLELLASLQPS